MLDLLIDALLDSLKVLGFSFIIYFILSFFEDKISHLLQHHKRVSPIIGAAAGLIPQCGISVVASDLYLKERITIGTLFAVFFACSDEALPILISDINKAIYVIPLLLMKIIFGFGFGYLLDLIVKNKKEKIEIDEEEIHIGCCHHEIDHETSKLMTHLVHPLLHSLKIFIYVLIVNIIFSLIVYFIGENNIVSFLSTNLYLTPIFAAIIGIIPNCASSVLLCEVFISGGIPFGALFTGLCMNAGLGLVYLLKNKKSWKSILILEGYLLITSVVLGYIIITITSLF